MRPRLAIVNPRAGGRRAVEPWLLDRLAREAEHVVVTEGPGHAGAIAANAHEYADLIVAGGDGTVLEVLQRMNRAQQQLTVVPAGRGNSLARDLGAEAMCIDLMAVRFANASGVSTRLVSASTVALGYPVNVALAADRTWRRCGGASYGVAAALCRPRPFTARVACDDNALESTRLTGWIANNTRYIASFLTLPRASCRDGAIEMLTLRAGFAGQLLHNLCALAHVRYEPVRPVPTRRVTVQLDEPQTLLVDGEMYPQIVSVELQVEPAAARCRKDLGGLFTKSVKRPPRSLSS